MDMEEHTYMEEHTDMEEHTQMEELAATKELAGMEELAGKEELAQIVEGTGEVEMAERTQAYLLLECAGGGKLPPRGFQAPQMSSLHVHVAQGQLEVSSLQGEAPWPGGAVWEVQCLAAACPCPSFYPSLAAYKTNINYFIHVSLSSLSKVITYFLTSMQVDVFLEVKSLYTVLTVWER